MDRFPRPAFLCPVLLLGCPASAFYRAVDNVHSHSSRNYSGKQYAEYQTGVIHIFLLSGVGPSLVYGYIIVSNTETCNTKNGTEKPL